MDHIPRHGRKSSARRIRRNTQQGTWTYYYTNGRPAPTANSSGTEDRDWKGYPETGELMDGEKCNKEKTTPASPENGGMEGIKPPLSRPAGWTGGVSRRRKERRSRSISRDGKRRRSHVRTTRKDGQGRVVPRGKKTREGTNAAMKRRPSGASTRQRADGRRRVFMKNSRGCMAFFSREGKSERGRIQEGRRPGSGISRGSGRQFMSSFLGGMVSGAETGFMRTAAHRRRRCSDPKAIFA